MKQHYSSTRARCLGDKVDVFEMQPTTNDVTGLKPGLHRKPNATDLWERGEAEYMVHLYTVPHSPRQ